MDGFGVVLTLPLLKHDAGPPQSLLHLGELVAPFAEAVLQLALEVGKVGPPAQDLLRLLRGFRAAGRELVP